MSLTGPVLDLAPVPLDYLTVRELAALLRYRGTSAPKSARKWIARNQVRTYFRSARGAVVKRADVDAVLAQQHTGRAA